MNRWTALLVGAAMTISAPAAAQTVVGNWAGTLDASGVRLRILVHVQQGEEGLSGTLDSPDQGANGIPIAKIRGGAGELSFTVPAVSGSYQGRWDAGQVTWRGEWRQGGMALPLNLAPSEQGPVVAAAPVPLPVNWQMPSDEAIGRVIAARNAPRQGQGMVIGAIDGTDRRVVGGGPPGTPFGADTVFEIGSITKVFTALLLADMANKGEVSLDDPADKYLPAGARMPERGGRKITLAQLSTHTSGLPRLPDNMPFGDPEDPYADYTEELMLAFLARYQLPRDIGETWEYSNLGVGLLGYLLGRAAGSDYETLLRERILAPLGMTDTAISLSPELQARFAPAYDAYLQPTKPWRLPAIAGAGGIRSTADDMLKFAAALLDPASPIAGALKTTLSVQADTGNPRARQALGWQVVPMEGGREVLQHAGGTGGFRSHLALEPAKGRAVVVLANSGAEPSATDLALHVLLGMPDADTPAAPPAPPRPIARTEVILPQAELDRVVGLYEFAPSVVFRVTREGSLLRAQREGAVTGPILPIFPQAPLRFFWRAVNGVVEFTTDASGKVTGAEAIFDAQTLTGTRLDP